MRAGAAVACQSVPLPAQGRQGASQCRRVSPATSITGDGYHQKETRVRPVQCRRVIRIADSKRRLSESGGRGGASRGAATANICGRQPTESEARNRSPEPRSGDRGSTEWQRHPMTDIMQGMHKYWHHAANSGGLFESERLLE